MAQVYENQEFRDVRSPSWTIPWLPFGRHCRLGESEFRHCTFVGSSLGWTRDPVHRTVINSVRLIECAAVGCTLHAAVLEDVLIDGARISNFHVWGAVFKHVTLRGR